MPYLGFLDVSGIQDYIYQSPKLQRIRAASLYVEGLTKVDGLFRQEITMAGGRCIFAAGGNASFIIESDCHGETKEAAEERAKGVFRQISRALLKDATGLEIRGAIVEYEPGKLPLRYQACLAEMERSKLTAARNINFHFTGMDGTDSTQKTAPADSDVEEKRVLTVPGDFDDLVLKERVKRDHGLPSDGAMRQSPIGELSQKGQDINAGLMAVVSVDGLNMGRRLLEWLKDAEQRAERKQLTDDQFMKEFDDWSTFVRSRWKDAWLACLKKLERDYFQAPDYQLVHLVRAGRYLTLNPSRGKRASERDAALFLPCRLIYQGGDDMSFACDAHIALSLVQLLVEHLEKEPEECDAIPPIFRELTVSVGVAFVDAHFPFRRAVDVADALRRNAKERTMILGALSERPPSCVDWMVNRQGALTPPDRDLLDPSGQLTDRMLRPMPLKAASGAVLNWNDLEGTALSGLWMTFDTGRNKLKDILVAAQDGPEEVKRLLSLRPLDQEQGTLSDICPAGFEDGPGFEPNGRTFLLDAAELFDIHYPLTCSQKGAPGENGAAAETGDVTGANGMDEDEEC